MAYSQQMRSQVAQTPGRSSRRVWHCRRQCYSLQQQPVRTCTRQRHENTQCSVHRRCLLYSAGLLVSGLHSASPVVAQSSLITVEYSAEIRQQSTQEPGVAPYPPTYITAPGRVVAIGDWHGDRSKAIKALRLAKVIAASDGEGTKWTGGDTVLVQLGDVLDRGDSEIELLKLLRELDRQARLEGGAVYMLNGNHESLNVCGDFRYVTAGALAESVRFMGVPPERVPTLDMQEACQVRYQAYMPGGPVARMLSENPTVLVVNDTIFVHGGLTMQHVQYGLERLNREVCRWMRADPVMVQDETGAMQLVPHPPPYLAIGSAASVMWNRTYGKEVYNPIERMQVCNELYKVLEQVGAKRLVVGHTPQLRGVNEVCNGCAWRIDVGMSNGVLGASPQVLEICHSEEGEVQVSVRPKDSLELLGSLDETDSVEL